MNKKGYLRPPTDAPRAIWVYIVVYIVSASLSANDIFDGLLMALLQLYLLLAIVVQFIHNVKNRKK